MDVEETKPLRRRCSSRASRLGRHRRPVEETKPLRRRCSTDEQMNEAPRRGVEETKPLRRRCSSHTTATDAGELQVVEETKPLRRRCSAARGFGDMGNPRCRRNEASPQALLPANCPTSNFKHLKDGLRAVRFLHHPATQDPLTFATNPS